MMFSEQPQIPQSCVSAAALDSPARAAPSGSFPMTIHPAKVIFHLPGGIFIFPK